MLLTFPIFAFKLQRHKWHFRSFSSFSSSSFCCRFLAPFTNVRTSSKIFRAEIFQTETFNLRPPMPSYTSTQCSSYVRVKQYSCCSIFGNFRKFLATFEKIRLYLFKFSISKNMQRGDPLVKLKYKNILKKSDQRKKSDQI